MSEEIHIRSDIEEIYVVPVGTVKYIGLDCGSWLLLCCKEVVDILNEIYECGVDYDYDFVPESDLEKKVAEALFNAELLYIVEDPPAPSVVEEATTPSFRPTMLFGVMYEKIVKAIKDNLVEYIIDPSDARLGDE